MYSRKDTNSDNNRKQTNDAQVLEPKKIEIENTRLKSQNLINEKIPQKKRKNQKMEKKILSEGTKEKKQRQLLRLRNQPRKDFKKFIQQSKIKKKLEFQKPLSN